MPFEVEKLEIPDVLLIKPKVFTDQRGFFMELFKSSEFRKIGIDLSFVQDNLAMSSKGVLRGLHYQLVPAEQGKLVSCLRGRIWDVAVDIRRGSPWFGKWVARELSEHTKHMLWIPPGFAHGYVSLEDNSLVFYKVTGEYSPEHERGILWSDPDLGISWPVENPVVSEKDASLPPLKDAEFNFTY